MVVHESTMAERVRVALATHESRVHECTRAGSPRFAHFRIRLVRVPSFCVAVDWAYLGPVSRPSSTNSLWISSNEGECKSPRTQPRFDSCAFFGDDQRKFSTAEFLQPFRLFCKGKMVSLFIK